MPSSIIVSLSTIIALVTYIQVCSALPSSGTISTSSKLFHNSSTCHKISSTDSEKSAPAKEHEFMSNSTVGLISIILALGSLIVAVIGVIVYRQQQRKSAGACCLPSQQITPPLLQPVDCGPAGLYTTSGVATVLAIQPGDEPQASKPALPNTVHTKEEARVTMDSSGRPTRPSLSHLRLRSSLRQLQDLKLSYRVDAL